MPLHPRALAALANLPHRAGKVFRRPDKQLYEPKDGEGGQIKTAFKGACRRAGIADFHPMIAATHGQRGTMPRTGTSRRS